MNKVKQKDKKALLDTFWMDTVFGWKGYLFIFYFYLILILFFIST